MTVSRESPLLLLEETRLHELAKSMIATYLEWPSHQVNGDVGFMFYTDLVDFVNFRVETADTAADLVRQGHVAEALALCRGLLENYLLLVLMVRGTKYFVPVDIAGRTQSRSELQEAWLRAQADLKARHDAGDFGCLEVQKHWKRRDQLLYVFEGLRSDSPDDQDISVPYHFFMFQDFRPESMRLNPDDYFNYFKTPPELKRALDGHRRKSQETYQHYLSYEALLYCLKLNGLVSEEDGKRVEAHYTFLGRFIHPTQDASRELHEDSNYHAGEPAIGMHAPFSVASRLLALAYTCHLLAGIFTELCEMYEKAPRRYIEDPGTSQLRAMINKVNQSVSYFWFINNAAPPYDRFKGSTYFGANGELAPEGTPIPSKRSGVAFDSDC